jgi:hypothetical protein
LLDVRAVAEGTRKISYAGYRFPPEIIHQAIWLSLRFTLSFREVEDLLGSSRQTKTFCGIDLPKARRRIAKIAATGSPLLWRPVTPANGMIQETFEPWALAPLTARGCSYCGCPRFESPQLHQANI